jgi:hypothetical protein
MRKKMRQMKNEITRLKRSEDIIPPNKIMRAPLFDQR